MNLQDTTSKNMIWRTIPDAKVRHVWADANGTETHVDPTFYADKGTPIDEDGDNMIYVRTEILA